VEPRAVDLNEKFSDGSKKINRTGQPSLEPLSQVQFAEDANSHDEFSLGHDGEIHAA